MTHYTPLRDHRNGRLYLSPDVLRLDDQRPIYRRRRGLPSESEWVGWFHVLLIVAFILIMFAAVHLAGGAFEVGLP